MSILHGNRELYNFSYGHALVMEAVLGKYYILRKSGLSQTVRQIIFEIFGNDGGKVWQALTQYALSHPIVVPYINEDPMMMFSLGLKPQGVQMPIRYVVSSGSGKYFDLGIEASEDMYIKLVVQNDRTSTNRIMDVRNNYSDGSDYGFNFYANNVLTFSFGTGNATINVSDIPLSTPLIMEIDKNCGKLNGNIVTLPVATRKTTIYKYIIPGLRQQAGIAIENKTNKICSLEIDKTNVQYLFYPIKRDGNMEFVDVISGNLATRVGTLTELFEDADGNQWTPIS